MKKNPGWKLDLDVIELVQEARAAMGVVGNADVIMVWAKEWKARWEGKLAYAPDKTAAVSYQATEEPAQMTHIGVSPAQDLSALGEKPMATRVETPYQIARREKLELLRAQLAAGGAGDPDPVLELSKPGAADPLTFPFNVMVNDEPHQVIEYKGRRVLQRLVDCGPPIMLKNLTPQETVIYWNERVSAKA